MRLPMDEDRGSKLTNSNEEPEFIQEYLPEWDNRWFQDNGKGVSQDYLLFEVNLDEILRFINLEGYHYV